MTRVVRRLVAPLVFAAASMASAPAAYAQATVVSDRIVSPTTVAYWQEHVDADGAGSLDLLVLWRGAPGWFFRGSGRGSCCGNGGLISGQGQSTSWMTYGDITFTIEFTLQSQNADPATAVVTILGRQMAMSEVNVVLVDGVDSATPAIVAKRHVDPRPTNDEAVAAIIKRSPELLDFLRCDVTLPDANQQAMMTLLCDQMRR